MADRLLALALATAHVALLTLAAVLAFHLDGDLGPLLDSVGTLPGTAGFLALWGVALLTHARALGSVDPWAVASTREVGALLLAGVAWGAVTGAAVFWLFVAGVVVAVAASNPADLLDLLSLPSVLIAAVATTVSLVAGAVVGGLAATLDALVARTVAWFTPEA